MRPRDASQVVLLAALVLGMAVRALTFANTRHLDTVIVDEQQYSLIAENLLHGNGFGTGPGRLTSIRPPLYPAMLAAIWSVAGDRNLQAVRLCQDALALLTAWLVFLLGRAAFGVRVARYGTAAFWLYPSLIFFNSLILTETLFTLLLVAFILLSVGVVHSPKWTTAIGCGVALGLAALARSVLWPLPVILCPLLVVLAKGSLRAKVMVAALVLAGYAIPIVPWAIRNTRLQGVVEVVDTMGGMNLRMGNYEFTPEDRMWDAVSLQGDQNWIHGIGDDIHHMPTEGEKDKWAQRKAIEYMRAHPGVTLRRSLIKFADFWGLEREYPAGIQQGLFAPPMWLGAILSLVIVVGYAAVALTGGAGLWVATPDYRTNVLLLLPVVAIMGAHTIVFGHSRYHLPLMPILALYGASLLSTPWQVIQRHRLAVPAVLTILVFMAIWIRQVALTDLGRISGFLERMG